MVAVVGRRRGASGVVVVFVVVVVVVVVGWYSLTHLHACPVGVIRECVDDEAHPGIAKRLIRQLL